MKTTSWLRPAMLTKQKLASHPCFEFFFHLSWLLIFVKLRDFIYCNTAYISLDSIKILRLISIADLNTGKVCVLSWWCLAVLDHIVLWIDYTSFTVFKSWPWPREQTFSSGIWPSKCLVFWSLLDSEQSIIGSYIINAPFVCTFFNVL